MSSYLESLGEMTVSTESGKIPVLSYVKDKIKEINLYQNKNKAFDSFENNFMSIKAVLFVMLIAMAIYYPLKFKTMGMIKSKPLLMLAESTVFALSAIIPFIMLVMLRNKRYSVKEIIKFSILIFVVFFVVNYLFELSGFYEYSFPKDDTTVDKNVSNTCEQNYTPTEKFLRTIDISLRSVFLFGMLLIIILMIVATLFVHDGSIGYNFSGINKWVIFFFETLLFGAISAVPIYFVASNRKDLDPKKTSIEFLLITAKFMLLHIVLQFSGFYNHFFIKDYNYA